ncbi:MAG: hypothetical protein EP149_00815 [Phascolarctobacterium sp.]|nr:hypothetical protein [Phascolarctobacterium sp.]
MLKRHDLGNGLMLAITLVPGLECRSHCNCWIWLYWLASTVLVGRFIPVCEYGIGDSFLTL